MVHSSDWYKTISMFSLCYVGVIMGAYDVFKLQGDFNNAEKNLAVLQTEKLYSSPSYQKKLSSSVISKYYTLWHTRYAHLYISIFCNRICNRICTETLHLYAQIVR